MRSQQQSPESSPGRALAPIAVLGMHRSGTSCLTGLLADAGVWLGDVSRLNSFNLKGNQERRAVNQLNERVLGDNGGGWAAPPPGQCNWNPERIAELRAILAEYPTDRPWAIKDPRACFTIGGWLAERPDLRLIGTFRHPGAVLSSLRGRGPALQVADEVDLWCRYNSQLLRLHARFGFPLVCFDLPPDDYLAQVSGAFARLGLALSPVDAGFFDEGLRSAPRNEQIPEAALALYHLLAAECSGCSALRSGTGGGS